jgi:hypothetical protein
MAIDFLKVSIGSWRASVKAKMALVLSGGFFRKGVALEGEAGGQFLPEKVCVGEGKIKNLWLPEVYPAILEPSPSPPVTLGNHRPEDHGSHLAGISVGKACSSSYRMGTIQERSGFQIRLNESEPAGQVMDYLGVAELHGGHVEIDGPPGLLLRVQDSKWRGQLVKAGHSFKAFSRRFQDGFTSPERDPEKFLP